MLSSAIILPCYLQWLAAYMDTPIHMKKNEMEPEMKKGRESARKRNLIYAVAHATSRLLMVSVKLRIASPLTNSSV